MNRRLPSRRPFWLAWSLWALTSALMGLTVAFALVYPSSGGATNRALNLAIGILFVATFGTVRAVIASRRPENPIGWVFCGMVLFLMVAWLCGNYAQYALVVEPGALPGAATAAWVGNWIWLLALSPLGFFLLLFPDGRPPSPLWRPVAWVQAAALAGWVVSHALVPGPLLNAGYPSVDNPYGIEAAGGVLRATGLVSGLLLLATVFLSAFSLVVRFRRSGGEERRQIKWVAYAGALVALVLVVQLGVEAALPETDRLVEVLNLSFVVTLTGVPIAAGVAILRYRLYDIDVITNRTLVYGTLTVLLAAVYLGGVVSLQYAFRGLTGQTSQLAVVASTLLMAALFGPLRRRVQAFIDHRFYRGKYDAARTLATLGGRLRDETDLNALSTTLVAAVRETVQPEHASLWLRFSGRRARDR